MNFKAEYLLSIAAIILAAISAYTTAEGFYLMWNDKTKVLYGLSWAFAIAVSTILVFCSIKVQQYFKEGTGWALVFVFVLFASLSMFFNFNSIHGNFTKGNLLSNDAKQIALKLTNQKINSIKAIEEKFKVTEYQRIHDSLVLAAKREEEDLFRPGQKDKWRVISVQIPGAKANWNEAKSNSTPYTTQVEGIYAKVNPLIDITKPISRNNLEVAIEGYNQMGTVAQSVASAYKFQIEKFTNNSGEPDYSLIILGRFFNGDNTLSNKDKSAVRLSIFLSFLLDFPVFIAIVLLNWQKGKKRKEIKDLFGDDNSGASNKKNDKGDKKISWD